MADSKIHYHSAYCKRKSKFKNMNRKKKHEKDMDNMKLRCNVNSLSYGNTEFTAVLYGCQLNFSFGVNSPAICWSNTQLDHA